MKLDKKLDVEIALTPEIAFWTRVNEATKKNIEYHEGELKVLRMVELNTAKEIEILEQIEKNKK